MAAWNKAPGLPFFYARFQVLENERIFSYWEMIAHMIRGRC